MNYKHYWGSLLLLIIFCLPLTAQHGEGTEKAPSDRAKIPEEFTRQKAHWMHGQAIDLMMAREYEEALKILNLVTDMAPNGMAYYNRGVVYRMMGDHQKAREDFGRAITLEPRPEYFYARGIEHLEQGDSLAAIPDIQSSLAGEASDKSGSMLLGSLYLKMGRYTESIEMFTKVVELEPGHTEALTGWGMALMEQRDTTAMKELLDQLPEDQPARGTLAEALGYIWFEEQRYADACKALTAAIQGGISKITVFNTLAILHIHLGNLDSAQYYCDQAIGADLQYAPSWNTCGVLNLKKMEYTKAETDLTMAITLQPKFAEAWYNRAYCREMMRKDEEACEDLKQAETLGLSEAKTYKELICP